MSIDGDDFGGSRYRSLQIGVVVDRKDPLGLGRVKIRIPGLCEPSTGWAFPLGTQGGGTKGRGFKSVPQLDSEVGVLFMHGDPDSPFYLCGHWGIPDEGPNAGVSEVPTPSIYDKAISADENPEDVHVMQWGRYELVVDERPGKEALRITDKISKDEIEFDGVAPGIQITATAALVINVQGLFQIDAATIILNGRKLSNGGQDI